MIHFLVSMKGKLLEFPTDPATFFRSQVGAHHLTNSCFLNVKKARKVIFTENITFCFVFGLIARRLR